MNILSFGEIVWDVYPEEKTLGGAPLNFAAHLKKHGAEVFLLSAVGDDDFAKEAIAEIEKTGVSAKYIKTVPEKPTGKCMVTLDENKVPAYNLLRDVAYDYIDYSDVSEQIDCLYFGTLALREEYNYSQLVRIIEEKAPKEIFVDVNIRPPFYSAECIQFAAKTATTIKISDEELPVVAGLLSIPECDDYERFAKSLVEEYSNLKCVIITLGEKGAYALDVLKNQSFRCDGVKVEVKSTVGAGDSFSAAFLYNYLMGKDLDFCLKHASRVAAFVVSRQEAIPEYDIEKFN